MSQVFDTFRRLKPNADQPLAPENVSKVHRYLSEDLTSNPSATDPVATVSRAPAPETHIVMASEQNHPIREHFRYLEHQLRKMNRASKIKRLLVTSAAPREGKTVVASNLATTLACGAPRVLLIDGDMRLARDAFGMADERGLAEVLEGGAKVSDVLVYLEALKVYYIPSGKTSRSPVDLLQGAAMRELLCAVEEFEWVIIDSPPLGAFADALTLAHQVDGVILVARSGLTTRPELENALHALKDCRIAGVVLNAFDRPHKKNYYHSYYGSK